jgi:hypothetical protein
VYVSTSLAGSFATRIRRQRFPIGGAGRWPLAAYWLRVYISAGRRHVVCVPHSFEHGHRALVARFICSYVLPVWSWSSCPTTETKLPRTQNCLRFFFLFFSILIVLLIFPSAYKRRFPYVYAAAATTRI